jgi:hypothetical protein
VESAPRAYKLKASNAAPPISTITGTSRKLLRPFIYEIVIHEALLKLKTSPAYDGVFIRQHFYGFIGVESGHSSPDFHRSKFQEI